jgi:RNA:NAD 2'-phosphotransferase (TPT1/KptA family)
MEEELSHDKSLFDYSDYPVDTPYYDTTNKKVIGKFKCETKGMPIVEFVGLRPKMYSYLYQNTSSPTSKVIEKHRVKGIASSASRALRHYDYKEQLDTPHENYLTNRRLGSKLHKIYAISCEKRGLCSFDDKRFLLDDGVHSLAYGHYSITNQVHRDDINISGGEQVMSNKDARDKGLIWSRRTEVLSLMGGKDHELNESNKEAVVIGVKTKLALMQVSEEIVKSGDAVEVPAIVDTESSVEQASSYVDESIQAEKTPIKRSKRQKPIKSTKRRRKESVSPNANANE